MDTLQSEHSTKKKKKGASITSRLENLPKHVPPVAKYAQAVRAATGYNAIPSYPSTLPPLLRPGVPNHERHARGCGSWGRLAAPAHVVQWSAAVRLHSHEEAKAGLGPQALHERVPLVEQLIGLEVDMHVAREA